MELTGIGVSPGIAVGPALIVEREERARLPRCAGRPEAVEREVERLTARGGGVAAAAPGHQGAAVAARWACPTPTSSTPTS